MCPPARTTVSNFFPFLTSFHPPTQDGYCTTAVEASFRRPNWIFLEILEDHLPLATEPHTPIHTVHGRDEWEYVARLDEKRYPGQDCNVNSLRKTFSAICRNSAPMGDPTILLDFLRAKKFRLLMTEWADRGDGDDLELKEDDFVAHEAMGSLFN